MNSLRMVIFASLFLVTGAFANTSILADLPKKDFPVKSEKVSVIPRYSVSDYDQEINSLYQRSTIPKAMNDRINYFSAYFLGKPYLLGALGEGPNALFDKSPLYRTDTFDCTTFVSTVLALAESTNLQEFKRNIVKINYQNSNVQFVQRNHFISTEWNKVNKKNGFISNMTGQFTTPPQLAVALIDQPNWYRTLTATSLKQFAPLSPQQTNSLLTDLRAQGKKVNRQVSHIEYLPFTRLFQEKNGQIVVNQKVFNEIPSGAIIEVVFANHNLTREIGTHLNVVHMGLAIRQGHQLMFREASSILKKVVDVPFVDYFKRSYLASPMPDRMGIHIEMPH